MPVTRNIIVVGGSGSGKSSFINQVVGRKVADTSNRAVGCTLKATPYLDNNGENCFWDTAGLDESNRGSISAKDAMANLAELLKNLEEGVNLLIFVIRHGRITDTMVKNYNMFVNDICQKKVPVVLAISRCESEPVEGDWYKENQIFFKNNDMEFAEVISGCFTNNLDEFKTSMHDTVRDSYNRTTTKLQALLAGNKYVRKVKFGTWLDWFKKVGMSVWNTLVGWFAHVKIAAKAIFKTYLEGNGFTEQEAAEVVNGIERILG